MTDVHPADTDLLSRMVAGDRDALAVLFRRHQASVYRFSRQMTGSRETAEDITQDVFVALAQRPDAYRPSLGSLTTYLYGIARNLVRQRYRRVRTRNEVELDAVQTEIDGLAFSHDPAQQMARTQTLREVRAAILDLPLHYREVIVLCELNGVSYEEAAAIVKRPIGTVRSRLSRARQMLIARCRDTFGTEEGKAAGKWLMPTKSEY